MMTSVPLRSTPQFPSDVFNTPEFRSAMEEWQSAHAAHNAARLRLDAARRDRAVQGPPTSEMEFALARSRACLQLALQRLARTMRDGEAD